MGDLYAVEIEPEVRHWLANLSPQHYRQVEEKAELLAERPTTLGEPHSRYLGDGVRELRLSLSGNAVRISYWIAPGQRIVLLTVFRKTKMREDAEVKRARQVKQLCEAEHPVAHETYSRDAHEEER
jgi:hypothetical protein